MLNLRLGHGVLWMAVLWLASLNTIHCGGCVTETGQHVDWYTAFRLPNSRDYLVYDSSSPNFRKTDETLLGAIIDTISLERDSLLIWNDQQVEKLAGMDKAHSKGFIHFEKGNNGFLYVHSIPLFIDTSENSLKKTTRETSSYAQSIVCVTLASEDQAHRVIQQLMTSNPNIYKNSFQVPPRVKPLAVTVSSDLPFGFRYVTKTSASSEHPFEEMLTSEFKVGWLVNTWSRPYKESSCQETYPISNIKTKNLGGVVMKSTQDHSKWALSRGGSRRIVCIGDMNHMDSQSKRGGSFLCREDPRLHELLSQSILEDDCGFATPLQAI